MALLPSVRTLRLEDLMLNDSRLGVDLTDLLKQLQSIKELELYDITTDCPSQLLDIICSFSLLESLSVDSCSLVDSPSLPRVPQLALQSGGPLYVHYTPVCGSDYIVQWLLAQNVPIALRSFDYFVPDRGIVDGFHRLLRLSGGSVEWLKVYLVLDSERRSDSAIFFISLFTGVSQPK
jgi:hypothetical protein